MRLYRGRQRTLDNEATAYDVSLAAASARVEPPRFTLAARDSGPLPALRVTVTSSREATVENLARTVARLTLATADGAREAQVTVPPGGSRTVRVHGDRSPPRWPTSRGSRRRSRPRRCRPA